MKYGIICLFNSILSLMLIEYGYTNVFRLHSSNYMTEPVFIFFFEIVLINKSPGVHYKIQWMSLTKNNALTLTAKRSMKQIAYILISIKTGEPVFMLIETCFFISIKNKYHTYFELAANYNMLYKSSHLGFYFVTFL